MRLLRSSLLAAPLFALLVACSSESSSGGGGDPSSPNEPGTETPGSETPKDPPLEARALCEMVSVGTRFAEGCSGSSSSSGSGPVLCEAQGAGVGTSCETDTCLYDRHDGVYDFYCASPCNVGSGASCPLGFECRKETCSTGRSFCAQRTDLTCVDDLDLGYYADIFEGPSGETLVFSSTGSSSSTLSKFDGKTLKTLTTWPSGSSSLSRVRAEGKLLLVSSDYEIVVTASGAKATKLVKPATTSSRVYGVDDKGGFVALEGGSSSPNSPAFAALLRRSEDGAWSEVGPTRQRTAQIRALNQGFVGQCDGALCVSHDGESFEKLEAPSGISFAAENGNDTFVVAGASTKDFYLAKEGKLFHYAVRNGAGSWVEEGPRGTPGEPGSGTRSDSLRAFADGSVVFTTYDATASSSVSHAVSGGCWKRATTAQSQEGIGLVKGALAWKTSSKGLCVMPIE